MQDAFLRWQAADRQRIKVPEAWLTKVVTNLCLDRLRSAQARRERAVGAWLPEPLLDGDPMLGPADTFEQRESVSLAVLTLMERLSPVERAVYVLREAFSYSHAEIAEILDITESASQQHLHRARRRITAARRRGGEVDPASARRIVEEFLAAASSGRTERLVALLTDDATAISDGAGLTETLLRYDTPQRIAAVARAGFKPTPAKRRLAGGSPADPLRARQRRPRHPLRARRPGRRRRDVRHHRRQDRDRARHRRPRPPRPPHRSLAAARTGHAAHHPVVTRRRPRPGAAPALR